MGFINMMSNDIWSESDIVRRTENMIRSVFSAEQEDILNRKATGAALGQYELTESDLTSLSKYASVSEDARQEGDAARADMALLMQVFEIESAINRLNSPVIEDDEQDEIERQVAQDTVDSANPAALDLVEQRHLAFGTVGIEEEETE